MQKTTTRPIQAQAASCKDLSPHCKAWAGPGYEYCDESSTYNSYMKQNCRKSCGWCPTQRPTTVMTTVPTDSNCKDNHSSCKYWKGKGHCTNQFYQHQMKMECPKTCGFCMGKSEKRPTTIATEVHSSIKPTNLTQLPPFVSSSTLSSNGKSSNTTSITPQLPGKTFSSVGAIAGGSAGIVLLLICMVIAVLCLKRRKKRAKSNEISTPSFAATKDNESLLLKHRAQAEDIRMKEDPFSGLTPLQTQSKHLASGKPKPSYSPADNDEEQYATPEVCFKNTTGSKQQVPHEYMEAIPDESHYQRLTIKHQNPIYQPLTKDYENIPKADSSRPQICENSAEFKR